MLSLVHSTHRNIWQKLPWPISPSSWNRDTRCGAVTPSGPTHTRRCARGELCTPIPCRGVGLEEEEEVLPPDMGLARVWRGLCTP